MKPEDGPKLPAKQLAILAVARFAEPLAMTSVFPYLPEMIASFGVDKDSVAEWAGITSAAFSLAQSLTAVWWGRASDKFGRKPVILTGLMTTMTCFLIWGLSTSLTMAITVRAVLGASNGNVGIIRTVVAEMVPEKELQPTAFSIMPLVWSLGSIFGPAFGGFFANPVLQFPSIFGHSRFLKAFPFALPNIMGSFIFMVSMTTAFLFLQETAPHKRGKKDFGLVLGEKLTAIFAGKKKSHPSDYRARTNDEEAPLNRSNSVPRYNGRPLSRVRSVDRSRLRHPKKHGLKAVLTPQTTLNLVCYTFLALHSVAFDQLLPVFLHYPQEKHDSTNTSLPFVFNGGFGLKSGSIGTIFTIYGITCGLIQFLVYPSIATRFGVLNCFKFALIMLPIAYFTLPYTVLIENLRTRYATLMVIMAFKAMGVIFAFPSSTILLTNSASSIEILATLNGLATTFSALGRATGPATAGKVFSFGAARGIMILPWWLLGFLAVIGMIPAWWIVEGDGPSGNTTSRDNNNNTTAGGQQLVTGPNEHEEEEEEDDGDSGSSTNSSLLTSSSDSEHDDHDDGDAENDELLSSRRQRRRATSQSRRQQRRRESLVAARAQPREIVAQPEGQDDQPLFSTSARSASAYGSIRK